MPTSTSSEIQTRPPTARWWVAAPVAAAAAAVANAIVYAAAETAGALPDDVLVSSPGGQHPIGLAAVLTSSVVAVLGAALLLAVLTRVSRRPMRLFWPIAAVVLVASLGAPLTIPGAPGSMMTTLAFMHVVAAVVGLATLVRLVRPGWRS